MEEDEETDGEADAEAGLHEEDDVNSDARLSNEP